MEKVDNNRIKNRFIEFILRLQLSCYVLFDINATMADGITYHALKRSRKKSPINNVLKSSISNTKKKIQSNNKKNIFSIAEK